MRVLLQNRMAAVVAVFSMAMSACLPVTEIRDTFADKTAPDSSANPHWVNLSNQLISTTTFVRDSALIARWTPSVSTDLQNQQLQRYLGSQCDFADGQPVVIGSATAGEYRFVDVPDGVYTFKVISIDRKGNRSFSSCSSLAKVDHTSPQLRVNETAVTSAPAWINASNVSAYPVSGTCTDSGAGLDANTSISVRVLQGTANKNFTLNCVNGLFSGTLDLTSATSGSFTDGGNPVLLLFSISDSIGNPSQLRLVRSRDVTLPVIAVSDQGWINLNNRESYNVTGTCSDASSGVTNATVRVTMSEGAQSVTGTGFCNSGTFSATLNTTTASFSEGINHIGVIASVADVAGNEKVSTPKTRSKDTIAPVLSITDLESGFKLAGGDPLSFTVELTEQNVSQAQTITATYSSSGVVFSETVSVLDGPLTNEPFAFGFLVPNNSIPAFNLNLNYTDLAGNPAAQITRTGLVDADLPQMTAISVDGGVASTSKFQIPIALTATDATSNITHFCVRITSATPSPTNSCWRALPSVFSSTVASKNISVTDFFMQVGLIPEATDTFYAWVRDELGHVSQMSQVNGVDQSSITYDPGAPPVVSAMAAVNASNNSRVIGVSESLKVQWTASDAEGLADNPVRIDYTLDDQTYLPFAGAQAIPNAANSCTPSAGYSACALVSAPSSSYFRVRVTVQDLKGTTSTSHSQGLNDSNFRVMAGNLDAGLNNAADLTVFPPTGRNYLYDFSHKQKFVVADDGRIFVTHAQLGILSIDPATRVVQQFIKPGTDNTSSGVSVSAATIKAVYGLALDYQNRLLIFDEDRIRRVDLSTSIISTLIGGGSNQNPSGEVNPTSLNLDGRKDSNFFSMIPLPNGDLYFSIDQYAMKDFRFVASTNKVVPINYTGSGLADDPNVSWTDNTQISSPVGFAMAFNPLTSEVTYHLKAFKDATQSVKYVFVNPSTHQSIAASRGAGIFNNGNLVVGMDGNIYHTSIARRTVKRYLASSNTIGDLMLGADNGNIDLRDICPDGTFGPNGCEVDVDSVFVNKYGRLFFMEKGLIRMLDQFRDVRTIYGKPMSFDGPALSAELGDLIYMRLAPFNGNNGIQKVVTLDGFSNQFRDYLFGPGLSAPVVQPIDTPQSSWGCFNASGPYRFALEPGTDNIYSSCWWNFGLSYFFRGSNQWFPMGADPSSADYQNFGGLPYYHPWADNILDQNNMPMGLPSTLIDMGPENVSVLGTDPNGSIFHLRHIFGQNGPEQCMLKKYDWMDWSGNGDWALFQSHFMGDNSCSANYTLDAPIANNSIGAFGLTNIEFEPALNQYLFARERGNMIYQSNVGGNLVKFADLPTGHSVYSFTHTYDPTVGTNIYYCSNRTLYRLNKSPAGAVTTTELNWGSPEIKCDISGIEYDADSNVLYFPVRMNGKTAIARYLLP